MIEIKQITTEQTYPIRHQILRKGFPLQTCYWEGDEATTTFHLGAFKEGLIVGIVSLMQTEKGYQLRGMAVLEDYQRKNIGSLLVNKAEEILQKKQINYLWMNARITAMEFYKKLKYHTQGTIFEVKNIGTHILMYKDL